MWNKGEMKVRKGGEQEWEAWGYHNGPKRDKLSVNKRQKIKVEMEGNNIG